MKKKTCEVCGLGNLAPTTERYLAAYNGRSDFVLRHSHVCDHCGGDYAFEADALENKREMIRFHKSVDSIPIGWEIRAMRMAAELTQAQAGELFGGGPTAFSKYESDDLVPTEAMIHLLKLAILDPGIVARLQSLKGVHVSIAMCGEVSSDKGGYEGDRAWEQFDEDLEGSSVVEAKASLVRSGSFVKEQKWTQ